MPTMKTNPNLLPLITIVFALAVANAHSQNNGFPPKQGGGGFGGPPGQGGRGGQGGPPGQQGFRPPPHPLETALDANNDGVIDEKEIANAATVLKKLDTDGDGRLSREELRPKFGPGGGGGRGGFDGPPGQGGQGGQGGPPGQGGRGGQGGPPGQGGPGQPEQGNAQAQEMVSRLMRYDRNRDNVISRTELPSQMQSLIQRGDRNNDGSLDRAEIEAMAQGGGQQQGPGRFGPPGQQPDGPPPRRDQDR